MCQALQICVELKNIAGNPPQKNSCTGMIQEDVMYALACGLFLRPSMLKRKGAEVVRQRVVEHKREDVSSKPKSQK